MTIRQKSYAKVGELISADPMDDDGTSAPIRPAGDMTEQWSDADQVLGNWIEVAVFNIGISAVLSIMQSASEKLQR